MTTTIMINGMAVLVLSVPREDTVGRILATIGVTYLAITIAVVNFFLWRQILDLWKGNASVT